MRLIKGETQRLGQELRKEIDNSIQLIDNEILIPSAQFLSATIVQLILFTAGALWMTALLVQTGKTLWFTIIGITITWLVSLAFCARLLKLRYKIQTRR